MPPSKAIRPLLRPPRLLPRPPFRTRLLTTPVGASSPPTANDQASTPAAPDYLNEKERAIFEKLRRELLPEKLEVAVSLFLHPRFPFPLPPSPHTNLLQVQDISGGCGSMYGIEIVSARFRGLSMIKQHRLVNGVLGEEIKGWHGVQLKTREG